jgi:hypothetical protein
MGHIDRRLMKDKKEKGKEGKDVYGNAVSTSAASPRELERTTITELTEALQRQGEQCEDCK